MTLLVDAGNSRVKWGILKRTRIHGVDSVAHGVDVFATLASVWEGLERPDRVVVASVAGQEFDEDLRDWVMEHWGLDAELVVPPPRGQGVVNAYAEPQRLGADRWAALVAARGLVEGPVCVVDCGTAITVDALAADGTHLGGLIVPGMAMMGQALVEHTRGIDAIEGGRAALLARDTAGAVRGGARYAAIALIDRVCADLEAELGGIERIIGGGDAGLLLPLLSGPFHYEPNLVLDGLARIAHGEAAAAAAPEAGVAEAETPEEAPRRPVKKKSSRKKRTNKKKVD
jgi:type III pantothenate kinase